MLPTKCVTEKFLSLAFQHWRCAARVEQMFLETWCKTLSAQQMMRCPLQTNVFSISKMDVALGKKEKQLVIKQGSKLGTQNPRGDVSKTMCYIKKYGWSWKSTLRSVKWKKNRKCQRRCCPKDALHRNFRRWSRNSMLWNARWQKIRVLKTTSYVQNFAVDLESRRCTAQNEKNK